MHKVLGLIIVGILFGLGLGFVVAFQLRKCGMLPTFTWLWPSRSGPDPPVAPAKPPDPGPPVEEICILCDDPIACGDQCKEVQCKCVAHVPCLQHWWEQSAPARPAQEVKSGILQLECPKCGKTLRIPRLENWGMKLLVGKTEQAWL